MDAQQIAGPPGQHIVIGLPETDADADAIRAAQLPRSPLPSEAALAEVAADLEWIDQAPEDELDALLAGLPDLEDDRSASQPVAPLTPAEAAAYERNFAEAFPDVARMWREVDGADAASVMVQDARRGIAALAGEPDTIEFIDAVREGLDLRGELAVMEALAQAGKRLSFNGVVGGPIGAATIETYESAPVRDALLEAESDGLLPKGALGLWANGRLGNAVFTIMNARRAIGHLARVAPELLEAGAAAGLGKDVATWRRLAELGSKLKGSKMQTTMKPAGEAAPARVAPADEAVVRGQLEHLMKDPKYWDPARRDPAYVRKIEQGFAKLYGGKS